jgi:hypothetical protein
MAARVQSLCQYLLDHYDGDAAQIWEGAKDGEDLSQYAITRQLETDEIKSKFSNSFAVAATRAGSQYKQKETTR